jgi:uroporphyrinogen decarboxylase
LIGKTPSELAQNANLIVEAQLCAYERYQHDLVTLGVDIYNVEAEAVGCDIHYYDSDDIPGIQKGIIEGKNQLSELTIPDPSQDGRMPLMLDAGSRLKARLQEHVLVGGSVVGPFTLGAILRGVEKFLVDMVEEAEFFQELLEYACQVGMAYGEALIDRGLGLSINESFCTVPFLSGRMYAKRVLPVHQKMMSAFRAKGITNIGLIIGGDTTTFSQHLVKTGTSILIADYSADLQKIKDIAGEAGVVLRGNVNPKLLEQGTKEELLQAGTRVLNQGKAGGRFLLGTGVVPYHAKPERLLELKRLTQTVGSYQ